MRLYESRLSYFNDKGTINHCKPLSVHQHGGPSRSRQNCHSCIFETKENSNLRICIQYLGHHSKTTCQKSAKSMRYRVTPKFEFYRKSLLKRSRHENSPCLSTARKLSVFHISLILPNPENPVLATYIDSFVLETVSLLFSCLTEWLIINDFVYIRSC